jgi:hypothetical protein
MYLENMTLLDLANYLANIMHTYLPDIRSNHLNIRGFRYISANNTSIDISSQFRILQLMKYSIDQCINILM